MHPRTIATLEELEKADCSNWAGEQAQWAFDQASGAYDAITNFDYEQLAQTSAQALYKLRLIADELRRLDPQTLYKLATGETAGLDGKVSAELLQIANTAQNQYNFQ